MNGRSAMAIGAMLVAGGIGGPMLTAASAAAQQSVPVASTGATGRGTAAVPTLRGFSLTLIQGDIKPGQSAESVPVAAAKALTDLKDFLPYKSYSLLDTSWTAGTGLIKSRLQRPDGQSYDVEMTVSYPYYGSPATRYPGISVTDFHVRAVATESADKAESTGRGRDNDIRALEAQLEKQRQEVSLLRQQLADGHPTVVRAENIAEDMRARLEATRAAARATRASETKPSLIDTSFRMDVGETVVVGTSRLQGDKALIVLVSAVGR